MQVEKTQTERFNMRTEPSFLDTIDDWRASQRPILNRSEAIRYLVLKALEHESAKK